MILTPSITSMNRIRPWVTRSPIFRSVVHDLRAWTIRQPLVNLESAFQEFNIIKPRFTIPITWGRIPYNLLYFLNFLHELHTFPMMIMDLNKKTHSQLSIKRIRSHSTKVSTTIHKITILVF